MDFFRDAEAFFDEAISTRSNPGCGYSEAIVAGIHYYIASCRDFSPLDRVNSLGRLMPGHLEVYFERKAILPNCGVYVFFDDFEIIYIGQTTNVKYRVRSHSRFSDLYIGVFYMEESELLCAESLAIGVINPLANFDGNSKYDPPTNYDWR